jgi:hypothetical protein
LGALDEQSATKLLKRGSPTIEFEDAAAKELKTITGRHAFWLQFLCRRLFEEAVATGSFDVTKAHVDELFESILSDPGEKPRFHLLYQEVESNEQALDLLTRLARLAKCSGGMAELAALAPDWNTTKLNRALGSLVDNQIVRVHDAEHRTVTFQVEALRRWMRLHFY